MKKLKKFRVGNLATLNQQEMMELSGGKQSFTCRTNEPCQLFIEGLGITVQGTCKSYANGTTVSCYCKNGRYSTSYGHKTSCWKS